MESTGNNYLDSCRKQFRYYKSVGDRSIDRMTEEQLHWQFNPGSNSIAIIAKHMAGNSLSRWTDFLTSDGEKEWRNRDDEFEDTITTKAEIIAFWNKGWQALFDAIDPLTDVDLQAIVYIRSEAHTVTEAVNRQLAHLAYHVGQIVTIAKMVAGESWISLTIPKGGSQSFNQNMAVSSKAK